MELSSVESHNEQLHEQVELQKLKNLELVEKNQLLHDKNGDFLLKISNLEQKIEQMFAQQENFLTIQKNAEDLNKKIVEQNASIFKSATKAMAKSVQQIQKHYSSAR